jgi:truncated hemoglobin YjbI
MSQQTPIDSIGLNRDSSSTLYERVGGKFAVTAVVSLFYDRIINDPLLLPFFDGIDVRWQKSKQVACLSTVFSGPRHSGQDLRQAHSHLVARGLNDKHFNAVAGHLQSTLEELSVPATLVEEIMAIVESTRDDVLGRVTRRSPEQIIEQTDEAQRIGILKTRAPGFARQQFWLRLAGKVSLAEAVVAAAEGKYEEAEAQFEKSIQIFRRYHVPFEEAEALHYQGRALNASGELAQANEKLDAAIEIYRRCGESWVELVEADKPPRIGPLRSRTEKGEDAAGVRNEAVFWREGDYWTVTYKGETWRLKGARGFHYIAYLLGHPREEIRALDLVARLGAAGEQALDTVSAEDLARTDVLTADLGHAGEMLDAQAKADYRRRLIELEDELEEARELGNEERVGKAEEEKEALTREIRRAVGLAGRDRRAASSGQRARVAVTKAIRLALVRISEQNRDLGRLLSTTIKTGAICSYVPDDKVPVSWRL